MEKRLLKKVLLLAILGCFISVNPLHAQLNTVFDEVFTKILGNEKGEGGALVPVPVLDPQGNLIETHADHFVDASEEASGELTPALNSLIAGNVSSFPLSSTAAGVTFDFSTGQPVSITESLGPIFAETGKTLGKGKINLGLNYTYLDLSKFRGLNTQDMRFSFTHKDVGTQGLGDSPNESDILDIVLDLDVNANLFAFFATMGITEKLDIGVAIPVISIRMMGDAKATINSFTHASTGSPNHHFGALNNPRLDHTENYNETATGLGDATLRLKYNFLQNSDVYVAALLDTRFPTGDKDNFMGTGKTTVRLAGILSKKFGDFTPHLNLGYDYRPASFDSDEFEFALGFDQKLVSGLTFAMDILGEMDLNKEEAITLFPGTIEILDQPDNPNGNSINLKRVIDKSNIPIRDNDNIINAALGIRFAPSERVIFLANVLDSPKRWRIEVFGCSHLWDWPFLCKNWFYDKNSTKK